MEGNTFMLETDADELYEILINDFKSGLSHGILVSKLAYELAKRLDVSEDEISDIKIAAMVHDIGKLKLSQYLLEETDRHYQ